nr:DoxX family membrane protein [Brevibacterium sp. 50QC2O2]
MRPGAIAARPLCWRESRCAKPPCPSKGSTVSLIRLLARPMLASAFVANGIARLRRPQNAAQAAAPVLRLFEDRLPKAVDATLVARSTGAAQILAGSLLAVGRAPRTSAAILVGTYAFDLIGERLAAPEDRRADGGLVVKTSLLGGALLASVDTAGRPGLAWRAQNAAGHLRREVEAAGAKTLDKLGVQN